MYEKCSSLINHIQYLNNEKRHYTDVLKTYLHSIDVNELYKLDIDDLPYINDITGFWYVYDGKKYISSNILATDKQMEDRKKNTDIPDEEWHDIIADPEDVPIDCRQVTIAYDKNLFGYDDFAVGEYLGEYGFGNTPHEVIAWKYIKKS